MRFVIKSTPAVVSAMSTLRPTVKWDTRFIYNPDKKYAKELKVAIQNPDTLPNIQVDSVWLEMPLGTDWIAAYRLLIQNGSAIISEMRVFPNEKHQRAIGRLGDWSAAYLGNDAKASAGGLTAMHVAAISIADARREINQAMNDLERRPEWSKLMKESGFPVPQAKRRAKRHPEGTFGRPQTLTDLYLAQIAKFYIDRLRAGSKKPIEDIKKEFQIESTSIARARIHEARKRGLLTAGSKGRADGQLTSKAIELLKGADHGKAKAKRGK